MTEQSISNLDRMAASTAQAMIRETLSFKKNQVENLITKTLGVLQENGVYACILFLLSRSSTDMPIATPIVNELVHLAVNTIPSWEMPDSRPDMILAFFSDIVAEELDKLLLTREVFEQTLIYARYGAKARMDDDIADTQDRLQASSEGSQV